MGLLDGIGSLSKLKNLLTEENIKYLDNVLSLLLTPSGKVYNAFWLEFQRQCGGDPGNQHFTKAAGALTQLHAVVKDQQRGGI